MNLVEKIIEVFDGTIIDEFGTEHFTIPGKKYDIQRNIRREWTCDCPAFRWQKKSQKLGCKHIKLMKKKRFTWLTQ